MLFTGLPPILVQTVSLPRPTHPRAALSTAKLMEQSHDRGSFFQGDTGFHQGDKNEPAQPGFHHGSVLELSASPVRSRPTHFQINKGKRSLIIPGHRLWLKHKREPACNRKKMLPVHIGLRLIYSTNTDLLKSLLGLVPSKGFERFKHRQDTAGLATEISGKFAQQR